MSLSGDHMKGLERTGEYSRETLQTLNSLPNTEHFDAAVNARVSKLNYMWRLALALISIMMIRELIGVSGLLCLELNLALPKA